MTPSELGAAVRAAVAAAVESGELDVPVPDTVAVERPRHRDHGDYATNAALQLAGAARRPPRAVAEVLAARLLQVDGIAAVEVAGPGFLNVRLAQEAFGRLAAQVVRAGAAYGRGDTAAGTRVNLEFVSANPTGPIHIGGVRWAAVGDALARVLGATGAQVTREYYVNDAGGQFDLFAASLLAAAAGEDLPEGGYQGDYVADYAARVVAAVPDVLERPRDEALHVFREAGLPIVLEEIRRSLRAFGVEFDVWTSELSLKTTGATDTALRTLREQGHVYEADGAVWLRTTDFGDDKDRVLVKSDGTTTYFMSDAAYYLDKRARGFDRCVYMLGADHHGYVGRLRAIAACAGDDPDRTMDVLIGQLVNVVQGGQVLRQSKRRGQYTSLDDLLELVGVDAARYSLARTGVDTPLDLDIELITRQANDNPVFYVQYAATRAASVLRHAAAMGLPEPDPDTTDVALLTHPRETELLLALAELPRVVASAAELREPHRIARHLEEQVAKAAQRFWDECNVLPKGDDEVSPLAAPRLLLWRATRTVLENGLGLLGVSAPERM
ncbi:MAG: arginine--tRNA ligase [Actinomycetota bacterium]|nr:arginine--tRNA ligase [Actinomycetota bacterium]